MMSRLSSVAVAVLATASIATAQSPYSIDTVEDIKTSSAQLAWDMMQYYKGNLSGQTPGILPGPPPAGDYYWWEGGAMWGTLIDYWHLTGDSSYNKVTMQGMQFQTGAQNDYEPSNITISLGNDDQGFWGMSAMLAAEENFPNPPADKPSWLGLAQAVFNTQAAPDRHDNTCGGGLRWQIPFSNQGYDYKNSIANGCFFNLGARLARYTGNETYANWARTTWDWITDVGFMTPEGAIYDGAHVETNCTDLNKAQFSYNMAVWALGAAFMFNHTAGTAEEAVWQSRTEMLVDHGLSYFFPKGIMVEPACEFGNTCTADMLSFKTYSHRWLSTATQIAPFLQVKVLPILQTSAAAAIKQCTGPPTGRACGFKWYGGVYAVPPGTGAGQQMDVLGAVSSLLIGQASGPVTAKTGGTSKSDPNAGSGTSDNFQTHFKPLSTGDKAGAGILTALILGSACGMFGWMSMDS